MDVTNHIHDMYINMNAIILSINEVFQTSYYAIGNIRINQMERQVII